MSTTVNSEWQPRITNDFPHFAGPILEGLEDGRRIFAFRADARHINDRGVVHGGMLMTFADQAFGELVLDFVDRRLCATVQLNTHLLPRSRSAIWSRRVARSCGVPAVLFSCVAS